MAEKDEIPEKIIDLGTLEEIDNPDYKKPEDKDEEEEEEKPEDKDEEEEEEKPEDKDEEEEEEKPEDKDEEEEEEKPEDKDEEEEEEKPEDKDEEEDFNTQVSDKYAEKYDINNEEELVEILDNVEEVLNVNEQLKTDLEEAKKQDPKFKSDKDKQAFEFLKNYSADKFGKGLGDYARLIGIDVEKMDGKLAMQEAFVLNHPELEREDAIELFNDDYEQYSLDSEDFEEEAVYTKKQKLKDIKKKTDVSKARSYLSEQQEKFKSSDEGDDKGDDAKASKIAAEETTKAVKKYSKLVDNSLDGFSSLILESDKEDDSPFTYKLDKDQLNKVELAMKNYLNTPGIYKDGEIEGFDADETKVNVSMALFGTEIMAEVLKHGISIGETRKVEKIGKKKPSRKSKVVAGKGDLSTDEQFEEQAKERVKARSKQTHYAD